MLNGVFDQGKQEDDENDIGTRLEQMHQDIQFLKDSKN